MDSFEESNLIIAAYIKRNDPRDVLILNKKKSLLTDEIVIGSSSKGENYNFDPHIKKSKI